MGKLPERLAAGVRVRARSEEWRLVDVADGDRCRALTLVGTGRSNGGRRRVLLSPFDRVAVVDSRRRVACVRYRRWLQALRAVVTATGSADHLRAAIPAEIDLYPYQLEPALAAVRHGACRLLLADEVGLGKTIQAGLILAELIARGEAGRCLILTPVGLRDQWVDELARRFSIRATVVDRTFVREIRTAFPTAVSPWTLGTVAVTSCDYAKRPEVLAGLAREWWDLLIVDEAHAAAAAAERGHLIERIGARSRRVVLLTATPHAGDEAAFSRLCRTGALDAGPILMFRRSRRDAGIPGRRTVARLAVTLSADERRMHAVLARYTRAAWSFRNGQPDEAGLALVVLNKRALSSAWSLRVSVERRMRLLEGAETGWQQPGFRFDEEGETNSDDEAPAALGYPALADGARERAYLEALAGASARAARCESKLGALRRLLRRTDEPVIVFTEFRDTLAHFAEALADERVAVLHGGLTRHERLSAERAFVAGDARVLLATDAAGEGLNLQARCRLIVNVELPWNPRRLEQRIGRVDRIGQRRAVRAWHLVARDTGEARVLVHLARRLEQARTALGSGQDEAGLSERDILGAMVGRHGSGGAPTPASHASEQGRRSPQTLFEQIASRAEGERETSYLQRLRRISNGPVSAGRLTTARAAQLLSTLDRTLLVSRARRGAFRGASDRSGLLIVYRVRIVTAAGHPVEELLLPLRSPLDRLPNGCTSVDLKHAIEAFRSQYGSTLDLFVHARAAECLQIARLRHQERLAPVAERERLMGAHAGALASLASGLVQQGLFDRRAVRAAARRARQHLEERRTSATRLAAIASAADLQLAADPEPLLMLFVPGTSAGRPRVAVDGGGT